MKKIRYFVEFLLIMFLLVIFKTLGFKLASSLGGLIGKLFGPLFRSKKKYYQILVKHFRRLKKKILN